MKSLNKHFEVRTLPGPHLDSDKMCTRGIGQRKASQARRDEQFRNVSNVLVVSSNFNTSDIRMVKAGLARVNI